MFKTEPTETEIAVFNNFFDSQNRVLKNENVDDIIETNTITENEVENNDDRREISKNSDGFDEGSSQKPTGEILQRGDRVDIEQRNLSQSNSRRHKLLEERKIGDVTALDKFVRFAQFVSSELTNKNNAEIYERYKNDSRWDEGYDFREMVTYDMLTDPNNELRILFADNIAEYFNENTDTTVDNTGESVAADILKATKNSVVKNINGQLILVYHGTDKVFALFKLGDIGIHFGSYYQAVQRVKTNEVENPIFIRAYLNIENPLIVDEDFYGWNAFQIAQKLSKMGVISGTDSLSYLEESKNDVEKANERLRNYLKGLGYDGIIYTNDKEAGSGTSYIVFDNEQIFRVDNASNESIDEEGVINESKSSVLERESESDGRGLRTGAAEIGVESAAQSDNGPHRDASGEVLSQSDGESADRPTSGNDGERVNGTSDAGDVESEAIGESAEITDTTPETIDAVG